jgi:hypothetical protein
MSTEFTNPLRKFKLVFLGEQSGALPARAALRPCRTLPAPHLWQERLNNHQMSDDTNGSMADPIHPPWHRLALQLARPRSSHGLCTTRLTTRTRCASSPPALPSHCCAARVKVHLCMLSCERERERERAEANIWRVPSVQFEAGVCGVFVGDAQRVRMRELAR